MKRSILSLGIALAAFTFVGACGGADGDGDTTMADTTTMQGTDTVDVPTAVPTTDTVVKTTTVDTLQGDAKGDTVRRNP